MEEMYFNTEDYANEVWKSVVGYEDLYQVSNKGRIKSLDKMVQNHSKQVFKSGTLKKQTVNKDGYYVVSLWKNGKSRVSRVHVLVAEAFIPKPAYKCEVDHINRIRTDNRVENLRWCTRKENMNNENTLQFVKEYVSKNRALKSIDTKTLKGSAVGRKKVFQYSKDGTFIASYSSITEAAKTMGVKKHALQCALDNNAYLSCDHLWTTEYKENISYSPVTTQSYYKAVQQLNENGEVLNEWVSVSSAAKALHTSTKQIRRLIERGKFRYAEN